MNRSSFNHNDQRPYFHPNPYHTNVPTSHQGPIYGYPPMLHERIYTHLTGQDTRQSKDHGRSPYTVNINEAAKQNNAFRTAIWTGNHFQVTLMSINVGEDIGLEVHPDVDQFLRIEQGQGLVQMGRDRGHLNFVRHVGDDSAIMVPAGIWHNLTNTGNVPLKIYTIYAPPEHAFGTVHRTKAEAIAAEGNHNHSSHRNMYGHDS